MKIRIGTRGSKLALWQANYIKSLIVGIDNSYDVESVIIKTTGDKIQDVSLTRIGGKGLFVKEIEKALLLKNIDIAVHSMKDMPALIPDELYIAATPNAEEARDAVVFSKQTTLSDLKQNALIGTTSLRRIVQLKRINKNLRFGMLRGNIDTRIRKLKSGLYDAIVIALAGVNRLGIKPEFMERLDIIPAAGQGIITIETRKDNYRIKPILQQLNHIETFVRAQTERGFITRLGGSCQIPIGAYASIINEDISIKGFVANPDGDQFYMAEISGKKEQAYNTGVRLAEKLLALGASEISELQV